MNEKCDITIEISMDYIVWMLDNPDKLDFWEKVWIDEFSKLWKEHLNEEVQESPTMQEDGQG